MTANSNIKRYIHSSNGTQIDVPNLYIDDKTGNFLVRVYHMGATRSKSLRTKSFTIAKARIADAMKEIVTTDKKKIRNLLVRDYYEMFVSEKTNGEVSPGTLESYSISWRHHIEPFWGNLTEKEITQEKFNEFLGWHRKTNGKLLYNPLKLLNGLVKIMRREDCQIGNVDIRLPKKEADSHREPKGTYVERNEFAAIYWSCSERRYRFMFLAAYKWGFRLGELVNLKKDRVKKNRAGLLEIHLRAHDTKTRIARIVPLDKYLSKRLQRIMKAAAGENVFGSPRIQKVPVSKQAIDRTWIAAKETAGVTRRIRIHDLRHTAATNFANAGLNPTLACAILGMSLKIYMAVYVKRQSLDLSSAIDAVSNSRRLHEK